MTNFEVGISILDAVVVVVAADGGRTGGRGSGEEAATAAATNAFLLLLFLLLGIGKFVESNVEDHSISKHLQKSYLNKSLD